jgi:hypothetical protein
MVACVHTVHVRNVNVQQTRLRGCSSHYSSDEMLKITTSHLLKYSSAYTWQHKQPIARTISLIQACTVWDPSDLCGEHKQALKTDC